MNDWTKLHLFRARRVVRWKVPPPPPRYVITTPIALDRRTVAHLTLPIDLSPSEADCIAELVQAWVIR